MSAQPHQDRSAGRPSGEPLDARFEYRVVTLPRGTSRTEAHQLLTEQAEYGRWELARVLLYLGGSRRIWLRRRILRVQRTL